MQTGGDARWFYAPNNQQQLAQAMDMIPCDIPIIVLGRGSNSLIPDDELDALILDLGNLQSSHVDACILHAEAGCRMPKIAQLAANHALSGLEFMATVPGDLGGGIAMNAGAFGQQVSDTLREICIMHRNGQCETLHRKSLSMEYRYTVLPPASIVVQAVFALNRSPQTQIKEHMRHMRAKRTAAQPLAQPNCGSVFKNPEHDYAARLIEACGLKGKQVGQAQISCQHANFIVNLGGASTADVLALIEHARNSVHKQFGITMETEVRLLGSHP